MLRSGEEYLASIRDGRRVMCGGELIEDLTSHEKTQGYSQQVAEFYDIHLDPEHQPYLTFVDESGIRRGDVISEMNRAPVRNVQDYERLLRSVNKGSSILFLVKRRGTTIYIAVKV
mgnify:CR=1 FL=1